MFDFFKNFTGRKPSDPARDGVSVTPHDTNPLSEVAKAFHIGVGGDVTIITPEGTTLTFKNCPSGSSLPWAASHVKATGTNATDIVGAIR